jgi:hypothetical protein
MVLNIKNIIHFLSCFANIYDIIIKSQFIGEVYTNLNRMPIWKSLLKRKERFYAKSKWIYVNRAPGGDCHRRFVDGYIDACLTASKETGSGRCLYVEHQTMVILLAYVPRGFRGEISDR